MNAPQVPQPTFYIFKCEQSAPPGMPKPSCVRPDTQDLFNHMAMIYRDWETDRKSTRLNSSHSGESRMPSSA